MNFATGKPSAKCANQDAHEVEASLTLKAQKLLDTIGRRNRFFQNGAMVDSTMPVMLGLFLAEHRGDSLTSPDLLGEAALKGVDSTAIQSLVQAGLAFTDDLTAAGGQVANQAKLGLTSLGLARMRGFLAEFPAL
jgi:hypothetical protein